MKSRARGGLVKRSGWLVAAIVLSCSCSNIADRAASADTTSTSAPTPTTSSTPTSTAAPTTTSTEPPTTTPPPPASGTALALLATLPVKGRAPKTGYSREQFGPAWADVDHNGCDTRNDILTRDLTGVSYRPGTHDCVVISGVLADPYTGQAIPFEKAHAAEVQIDHVVALGDAWQTGAQQLSPDTREHMANDPLNLLAVDGSSNESKSDSDAASWLPPNRSYRCPYVARQVTVKATYGLWVTPAEHDAIATVLATCPNEPAANAQPGSVAVDPAAAPPPPPPPSQPVLTAPPAPIAGSDVVYANCAAARAAGVAPIHVGQPGYSSKLDRDGDGVACE